MTTITDPIVNNWYKDVENDLTFIVVAIEDSGDTIEVQYANGDISEFDKDSWYSSTFDYIETPEDWSAPYGQIEKEDLGYSEPDLHRPFGDDMDLADWLD